MEQPTRQRWPSTRHLGEENKTLGEGLEVGMSSGTTLWSSVFNSAQEKSPQSCCKPGYPAACPPSQAASSLHCSKQSAKAGQAGRSPPPSRPPTPHPAGLGWTGAGAATSTSHMAPALGPSQKFQPVSPAWQRGLEAVSDTNAHTRLHTGADEMHFGCSVHCALCILMCLCLVSSSSQKNSRKF